jgi:non-specific serine/threonine protein kinase
LIGRDRDLGMLRDLVLHGDGRLVTLTGVGGVGKTSLALEVVRTVADDLFEASWSIDLSATPGESDSGGVATRWVDALGLVHRAGSPVDVLVAHLRARAALVLVDNCEHVAQAVAELVDELLDACPYLRLVATSRVPLKVRGESVYAVRPLTVPDGEPATGGLGTVPAVALFVARAREADPDFRLDDHETPVAGICRRLAGLPLAIELAAAHVHALSPAEIEQRLAPEQGILASERLATSVRQVSLQATMDWSYGLLEPREQRLFRGLSVFAGGWTLEAAEAVFGGGGDGVRSGLQHLVEQSLVVREASGAGSRFRFLEPVGEYAGVLLEGAGERAPLALAHAQYFLALAARREPGATAPTAEQMNTVAADYPNCMAAIRFAEASGQGALVVALTATLGFLWRIRGNLHAGLAHLERALALAEPGPSRPQEVALLVLADLERIVGRPAAAMAHAMDGLAVAEGLDDPVGRRTALAIQGDVAAARHDYATAHARYQQAWRVEAEPHPIAVGYWHANVGHILLREDRIDESATQLEAALAALAGTEETWYTGRVYCWLGAVERRRWHLPAAREYLARGLEQLLRYGDRVDAVAGTEELARVALAEADATTAATLLGATSALRDSMALPVEDREALAADLEMVRGAQPAAEFATAWARGRALSFDEVVALARAPSARPGGGPSAGGGRRTALVGQLTRREREVAELVAQGLTNPQIAERLFVSPGTVRGHVEHILGKLGLTSRVQVATWIVGAGEKPVI